MSPVFQAQQVRLDAALRGVLDGVFIVDRDRQFLLFNEGCERITGHTGSEVIGRPCQCDEAMDCHDPQGRPLWGALCPSRQLFDGSIDSARQRMQIRRADGTLAWIETIYTPVKGPNGRVEAVTGVIRDISDVKQREDELVAELAEARNQLAERGAPGSDQISAPAATELQLDRILAEVERKLILQALEAVGGHRNNAARIMRISRSRLYRRMEALGIDPDGKM